jgi:hypothetical protein
MDWVLDGQGSDILLGSSFMILFSETPVPYDVLRDCSHISSGIGPVF